MEYLKKFKQSENITITVGYSTSVELGTISTESAIESVFSDNFNGFRGKCTVQLDNGVNDGSYREAVFSIKNVTEGHGILRLSADIDIRLSALYVDGNIVPFTDDNIVEIREKIISNCNCSGSYYYDYEMKAKIIITNK